MHTREIAAYGGLVNRMPLYAFAFLVFTMANVGLPGTSGFVGEFLTMAGAFQANSWVAIGAATGVILSAAYALYLYRRVVFGALVKPELKDIQDLNLREIITIAPLIVATIFFGVYPKPVLDVTGPAVQHMLETMKPNVTIAPVPRSEKVAAPEGEGEHGAKDGSTGEHSAPAEGQH
jgi:NADH-quinone oxidoreductase subunit M